MSEMLTRLLTFNSSSNNRVQYDNVEYETYRFCVKRRARGDNLKKQRMLYAFIPDYVLKSNKIQTSKYTILNFIPKILQYQFSKLANIYFFIIGLMQMIPSISISDGKPVMFLPFSVIMGVSAFKELLEDMKRHRQDRRENKGFVQRIDKQEVIQTQSQDIYPGHVIKIEKNQQIPADIVILKVSDENGICFVETMNLDGETNLKQKTSVKEVQELTIDDIEQNISVTYEAPNRYLYQFNGKIKYQDKFEVSLNNSNVLLKGSDLRNTEYVYGLVIYTGPETKVMMNSIEPSPKLSSLERQMNKLIIVLFLIQMLLCVFSAYLSYFMFKDSKDEMDYLYHHDSNQDSEINISITKFIFIKWGTWVLIFTNFIPISLLVTLELVKFYQGFQVQRDEKYYYNVSVQSSSLNEELGQINHIFSDKTGTLTQNKMEFKSICVEGINYGGSNQGTNPKISSISRISTFTNNLKKEKNVDFEDYNFQIQLQQNNQRVWDALYCLAICHNVIAELPDIDDQTKEITYNAASPDELALVSFAKFSGLTFKGAETIHNKEYYNVRNNIKHLDEVYEILQVFEFDSTRKRFTIITRSQKNEIEMFMKGADNIIESLLGEPDNWEREVLLKTKKVAHEYATQGLRTLYLAKRAINNDFYNQWEQQYNNAKKELVDREQKMEKIRLLIEKDLKLLGCTAIEDKLQDDVGPTIYQFRQSGIKFWVLTGDKKETAINISLSSKIIDQDTHLIDLDFNNEEDLRKSIEQYNQDLETQNCFGQKKKESVIIQGETFHFIEKNKELSSAFVKLCLKTETVIGCRFSPKQKQAVVQMVRQNTKYYPTLAIGDGANDVNMILQAHVGVGIKGVEGSQASRASDFSISEFKQLRYLLYDFGRECYRKNSELVLYNFYKNVLLVVPQWWYGLLYNMFSGVSFYDPWLYQLYNTFYTALPIVIYAIIDREHRQEDLIYSSDLYLPGMSYNHFNVKKYIMNLINGCFQSFILMYFTFATLENRNLNEESNSYSFYAVTGMVSYGLSVLVSNLKIFTFSYANTFYSIFFVFGSYAFYLITYYFFTEYNLKNDLYKSFSFMNSNLTIYFLTILVASICFLLDLLYQRLVDFYQSSIHEQNLVDNPPEKPTKQMSLILSTSQKQSVVKNSNYHYQQMLLQNSQNQIELQNLNQHFSQKF
ncbi:phospholipid-translocating P-type ATPase, flippase family protein (macronuclear) [Tetrahymena thermophila SB210]|uniref:Phospholipid-transporting ATPase n=1 Tax=Tetrahymena thermophila (strain SB210) TaxID=312017 RepID=Q23UD0_TETTS|nr:phospholipid-translocating P-type ATPase, flippase family protein [Tetrahymena thermophila SB210]EAS00135.1 phospholipid-translocating P-type ATPase, flippase family protein [Tetrahymena thermophila SB210]|eukprot:XP_001020380.1 phospholipid-translocating P-type ATPase, flippase family protein [Tetrahymena thermophila SB210]